MLTKIIVIITLQYMHISKHYIVHLNIYNVMSSHISIKVEKEEINALGALRKEPELEKTS